MKLKTIKKVLRIIGLTCMYSISVAMWWILLTKGAEHKEAMSEQRLIDCILDYKEKYPHARFGDEAYLWCNDKLNIRKG